MPELDPIKQPIITDISDIKKKLKETQKILKKGQKTLTADQKKELNKRIVQLKSS